jgi:flavin-dependent dehydrogenase
MTIAATTELGAAARKCWDAVVVGAGPAGATAARELARRGASVLLVDRAAFPRYKVCGCCLNARALTILAGLQLASRLKQAGAVPLARTRLAGRSCEAVVPLPGSVALSREVFDTVLITAAIEAGADFLPETRAKLGDVGPVMGRVLVHQDARTEEVVARVVLSADGLAGTFLAGDCRFRQETLPASRIGAGVITDEAPAFYEVGTIYLGCGTGGYVGLVRLEDGRLDLAAAFDAAAVRLCGGLGPVADCVLREVGWPAPPGLAGLPWRGTPALMRRVQRPAVERLLVLGDAAAYVEPFTGEGMAWALAAGVAAAPLAWRAARKWTPDLAEQWCRVFQRLVTRRQLLCRVIAALLRRPPLLHAVLRTLSVFPALSAPVVRQLHLPAPGEKVGCP